MAPAYSRGDKVYCTRTDRVKADRDYILAAGTGRKRRLVLVRVKRATALAYHIPTWGGWDDGRDFNKKRPTRLSRSRWRPVFKARACTYNDPQIAATAATA